MNSLPIVVTLYTSTKGHWGCKDLYLHTINHLNKECPLSYFGTKLAHIKVTPGEESVAEKMESELKSRGFSVFKTVAGWSRGTEHQHGYLGDMRTVSMLQEFHSQPFMLLLEDDSPFVSHSQSLTDLLGQACQELGQDHELVSLRTLRRGDLSSSPMIDAQKDSRWFWSPHFNFQPAILRTRDWYHAHRMIETNWSQVSHLQCELLLRLVFEQFSRRQTKHAVYWPDYAETFHLGTPDWQDQVKLLSP